jgi:putative ABC transport system permease protein
MRFSLVLAWRELRASWKRLIFFFLSIAIGVGAIVSLRSLVQNLKDSVARESRSLLTADLQVSSNTPWGEDVQAVLDRIATDPAVTGRTEMIETTSMLRAADRPESPPRLAELKAVQSHFPFYGEMSLSGGTPYSHNLLKGQGILVREGTLASLSLRLGDRVRIGTLEFTIRGTIEKEPGNTMNAFSLGPRVLLDYDDAAAAGLLGFGSRARYRTLFKTSETGMERVLASLREALQDQPGLSVRSFRYSQDRLSESLTRVEDYLSLIGLVILVLGGIGISSVTQVFVQQKMRTIAILKCLGGTNRRVLGAYLVQVLALGAMGSLLGLGLAWGVTAALPRLLGERIPFNLQFGLTWEAVLQGLGIGLLIALLFSLLPLLQIRQIKPILVLRSDDPPRGRRIDWERLLVGTLVLGGLLGLAGWQAGSWKIGTIFLVGLMTVTLVLSLTASLLMKGLRGLRWIPSFPLRQGVNSLYRPGNQTRVILMAVGLGIFLAVSVRSLQINLRDEFVLDLRNLQADLYLIDIQRDQQQGIAQIVAEATGTQPEIIPTIRTRIAAINGQPVSGERPLPTAQNQGLLGREYVVTYRDFLEPNERLLEGVLWKGAATAEPEISIEELLHRELGLNLGDRVTFDILGRTLTARVSSIRRVEWRNARTGFLIIFQPGALDEAPTMYISALRGPAAAPDRARLQREIVDRFPNVSLIDVRDIIEIARDIVENVSLAISFVGAFVILSGLLILVGSIAMTKYHRLYEAALFKTLGARRRLLILITLFEYGVLGTVAGLLGSLAAIGLTWAISEKALQIPWHFNPGVNLLGLVAGALIVSLIGLLASGDVLLRKPLGILRNE